MGAAAYGGKGFRERARVSGERPIGAASCRQQYNQASCQPPPPPRPTVCQSVAQCAALPAHRKRDVFFLWDFVCQDHTKRDVQYPIAGGGMRLDGPEHNIRPPLSWPDRP